MGIKKTAALIILLSCFSSAPVYAASVDDLYEFYNIPYVQEYPEGTLSTIRNYNNAHRFYSMYNCVVNLDYDDSVLREQIEKKEMELQEVTDALYNAYSLSTSEIFELEDKYIELTKDIDTLRACCKTYEIELTKDYDAIPTKAEYEAAVKVKETVDAACELGPLQRALPVDSTTLLSDKKATSIEVVTVENSPVKAMYSGTVSHVGSDYVGIDHGNEVFTYYGYLNSISVSLGDTVKQNDTLGNTSSKLLLKLKLGNKLVDISKLFEEVN